MVNAKLNFERPVTKVRCTDSQRGGKTPRRHTFLEFMRWRQLVHSKLSSKRKVLSIRAKLIQCKLGPTSLVAHSRDQVLRQRSH